MDLISDAIVRADYFRRSPFAHGGRGGHKEWLHFCVHGPQVAALINFSVVDERRHHGPVPWQEAMRLTVLTHDGQWDGDVEVFDAHEVHLPGGKIHARYGPNSLRFIDGAYHIHIEMQDRPITMDLRLRPLSMPGRAPNLTREDGPPIHWVVVPRLEAHGTITIDGRVHELHCAPAYHDHNWGHWCWGDDFAWEWGFGQDEDPQNPWNMVFVRLTNRARTRIMAQAFSIWKHGRQMRTFREQEVTIFHEGKHLRPGSVTKIPRVMGLIAPALPTDVPHYQNIVGHSGQDRVTCRFEGHDVSQVIIPNDNDFGVTIINEVSGELSMEGQIDGESIEMAGRAVFEFLGA